MDISKPCGICLGTLKTGLMAIKCKCGKYYHESCGVRVGECPTCERKFKLEQLAKLEDEGSKELRALLKDKTDETIKKLEELEESELSKEEFEKQRTEADKAQRQKFAEILGGLEERLARGEISEATYLMLREKYEK